MSFQAMAWAIKQTTGDPTSKLLLLTLANFADENGRAWPSINRLVKDTEISKSTVIRKLELLEEAGFLKREASHRPDGGFSHNIYTLTQPALAPSVTLTPPLVSQGPPPSVTVTPKPINQPIKETRAKDRPSALPLDWFPDAELRAWAGAAFPKVNLDDELEAFRNHFLATGKLMLRWDFAFRNWLRRSSQFAGARTVARPARLAGAELDEHNRRSARDDLDRLNRPRPPSTNRLFG